MSYVVLARKYRPMLFADMVGQDHIGRTLRNAITQGRVHHAYLFCGARGLGKTTTARIFAKALVCEAGPAPEPCNECEQCRSVTEGRSVDVVEIDGASHNSVDNIRSLREQVYYLPQSARFKVYIIDEVHMLTTSAFNALLKTLEEPPPHVKFIFATTEPHKVLATIMSRVSRLDFRRISVAQAVTHLGKILADEGLDMSEAGLRIVARTATGSVRDALTLLDQVIAFSADPKAITEDEVRAVLGQAEQTAVSELVDAVLARDVEQVLTRFDALTVAGYDLSVLAVQMLEDLRDLMVTAVSHNHGMFIDSTEDELKELRRRVQHVEPIALAQVFDRLGRIVDRLPQTRSQRLVLEMGLLELVQAEPLVPVADLVSRLEAVATGQDAAVPKRSATGPSRGGGHNGTGGAAAGPGGSGPRTTRGSGAGSRGAAPPDQSSMESPAGDEIVTEHEPHLDLHEPVSNEDVSTQSPVEAAQKVPDTPVQSATASTSSTPFETSFAQSLWAMAKDHGVIGSSGHDSTFPEATSLSGTAPSTDVAPTPAEPSRSSSASSGARVGTSLSSSAAATRDCAGCGPAPAPIELDNPFAAWTQLVASIREEDEYASAVLGEVGLAAFTDMELKLVAPKGSFAHTELSSSDLRARVEQAVRYRCGLSLVVTLDDGEPHLPETPSLVLVERSRREERRRAAEEEALAHPGIVSLLKTFDGHISATKPF